MSGAPGGMPPAALVAALAWSLAGPLLRRLAPGADPTAGLSLTALGLLGWVALAGLPRGAAAGEPAGPSAAGAAAVVGLALPALALAAALDLGAGLEAPAVAGTLGFGLALVALLALAAGRAARAPAGARRLHGALWLVLVPVLAVLPAVALWGTPRADRAVPWTALSPLGWTARRALDAGAEPGVAPGAPGTPAAALALAAALAALATAGGQARGRPDGGAG